MCNLKSTCMPILCESTQIGSPQIKKEALELYIAHSVMLICAITKLFEFQNLVIFVSELCRKAHEEDGDANSEDCDAELCIIWF